MDEFGVYKKGDFRFFIPTATYDQLDAEVDKLEFDEQVKRLHEVFDSSSAYEIERIFFEAQEELGGWFSLRVAITDWLLDLFLYRIYKQEGDPRINLAMYDRTTPEGFQYFMEVVQWATISAWNILLFKKKTHNYHIWPGDEYTPIPAPDLVEMNGRDANDEGVKFEPIPLYVYPLNWLADKLWDRASIRNPETERKRPVEYECLSPKFLTYVYEIGINTDRADNILYQVIPQFQNDREIVLDLETKNRTIYSGDLLKLNWVYNDLQSIFRDGVPRLDD